MKEAEAQRLAADTARAEEFSQKERDRIHRQAEEELTRLHTVYTAARDNAKSLQQRI